jgi:hypothetical protein
MNYLKLFKNVCTAYISVPAMRYFIILINVGSLEAALLDER